MGSSGLQPWERSSPEQLKLLGAGSQRGGHSVSLLVRILRVVQHSFSGLQNWQPGNQIQVCLGATLQSRAVEHRDKENYTPHNALRLLFAAVACGQSEEAAVAGAEEGHFKRAGDCGRQWPWRIQRLQHRRQRQVPLAPRAMHLLSSWANPASSR